MPAVTAGEEEKASRCLRLGQRKERRAQMWGKRGEGGMFEVAVDGMMLGAG